jgi:hypothetical protein
VNRGSILIEKCCWNYVRLGTFRYDSQHNPKPATRSRQLSHSSACDQWISVVSDILLFVFVVVTVVEVVTVVYLVNSMGSLTPLTTLIRSASWSP